MQNGIGTTSNPMLTAFESGLDAPGVGLAIGLKVAILKGPLTIPVEALIKV